MNPFIRKLNTKLPCTVFLITLICSAIFVFNATKLNSWFIDDAVISFSYARSLAGGFGLVAQPGAAPVEGFSNPIWVILLSIVKVFGFDILASTKIIATIFSIGTILLASSISYKITRNCWLTLLGVSAIALQPSIIIWFVSGLENSLYAFLILLLLWITLQNQNNRMAICAGITAALIGLTRPEGAAFLLIYLISHHRFWKPFLISFFLLFGAYLGFRLVYFGYPLPNTYYIKVGTGRPAKKLLNDILINFLSLDIGIFGKVGFWIGSIIVPYLLVIVLIKKKIEKPLLILLYSSALALLVYLFLPPDWMKELRFAIPILALFPILLISLIYQVWQYLPQKGFKPVSIASLLILTIWLTATTITDYLPRMERFCKSPTVSFATVYGIAQRMSQMASVGGITSYSVLQSDAGGVLWLNEYKLIDLGGLTDAVIARTLGKDQARLHNYIFAEVKPDILELNGKWEAMANLQGDPRLAEDYLTLYSYKDPEYKTIDGNNVITGIYIRKDLNIPENQIERMEQLAPFIMPP